MVNVADLGLTAGETALNVTEGGSGGVSRAVNNAATVANAIGDNSATNLLKAKILGKHKFAAAQASAEATETSGAAVNAAEEVIKDGAKAPGFFSKTVKAVGESKVVQTVAGPWGVVRKVAGYAAIPLTFAVGAFQTHKAIKQKDGHGAMKIAGGTVGSVAGMIAADIAVDAAMGSFLGPVGTAGGIAFGLVTGVGMAIAGSMAGSKAADAAGGDALQKHLNRNNGHVQIAAADAPGMHSKRVLQQRELALHQAPIPS
jgi:hypothetical protein